MRPLSPIALVCLEKDKEDPDYALKAKIRSATKADVIYTSQKMRKYVNARCKDLLEVTGYDDAGIVQGFRFDVLLQTDNYVRYQVDFLHRTVRDFLKTKDVHNLLRSRTVDTFDPRIALCRMLLAQIKGMSSMNEGRHRCLTEMVYELMYYAREVEYRRNFSEGELLDELDFVLTIFTTDDPGLTSSLLGIDVGQYRSVVFLAMAVESNLNLYVGNKLDSQRNIFCGMDGPHQLLLDRALWIPEKDDYRNEFRNFGPNVDTVQMLLSRGARPHASVMDLLSNSTIWLRFLDRLDCDWLKSNQNAAFQITLMLIRRGAPSETDWQRIGLLRKLFSGSQFRQLKIALDENSEQRRKEQKLEDERLQRERTKEEIFVGPTSNERHNQGSEAVNFHFGGG